jgi:hypothetical protein
LERVCRAYSRPDVAYRLLQLRYDVRATKPELFNPRRDGGLDLLPFLSAPRGSLARAVTHGEPRYVHPPQPRCRFLLLAQAYPTAMPFRTPHLRSLRLRSIVRIDVHGSKDRVKDASPEHRRRSLVPKLGACALWRMLTTFPSSAPFGHPLSSARPLPREDYPLQLTDRPRPSFRWRPAKSAAFQKTRMPSTVTSREGIVLAKGLLPSAFAPALSLTPPTPCPEGRCF